MMRLACVFILCFHTCTAVIYHLNDSEYARMPPLYGLDEYSSCLVASEGTYCVLRLDLYSQNNTSLINMIREYSANKLKHYDHTYIQRGVCVTKTCKNHIKNNSLYTTEGLMETLEGCLNESIHADYGIEAKLTYIYNCDKKDEQIKIDVWDWLVLGIYVAVAVVNCVATLYDIRVSRSNAAIKGNQYILSFSIIQNWKRLLSPESEEVRAKRLTAFHGMKVLTLFLMFIAHVIIVNGMGFNVNTHDFEQTYENPYYQMIFNGMVVIQIFFVISGFLLVYNLEHHCEQHDISWGKAVKIWFMRFWRLTPSYALMIAFMSTWLRHLGSGPLWKVFVAQSVVPECRRYWWTHLLYINNYVTEEHLCAFHTWHIAADTQLFCVGLFAYLVTRRGGRLLVLGLLIALGIVLPAVNVWAWDLDALVLMSPETYRTMDNDTFFYMHVLGHNNLVCYALGMAAASLVYRLQKKGVCLADNKVCQFLCWLVIPAIALLLYSGSIFFVDGWAAPLPLRMAFAAVHRLIMGVIVAFVVVVTALRLNSYIRSFFESSVWLVPSRLSYTVYLLHLIPIHTFLGRRQGITYASTYDMTILHFGLMLFTFMIALPFSLMVEAPIMRIMKISPAKEEQTKV